MIKSYDWELTSTSRKPVDFGSFLEADQTVGLTAGVNEVAPTEDGKHECSLQY